MASDPLSDALGFLYRARTSEAAEFGEHWCGPEQYEPQHRTLVAKYEPASDDGLAVTVYCEAWPARFYSIETDRYKLTFGSGQAQLAALIAESISAGTLGVHVVRFEEAE